MNAKQGFLFQKSPDFVVPESGSNYRNYIWYSGDSGVFTIPVDDTGTTSVEENIRDVFSTPPLFFPSIAPLQKVPTTGNRYLCDISFRKGQNTSSNQMSFTNLPIHDHLSQDIQALARNQYLLVETTISKDLSVSFNFIVGNWVERTEEVIFN